MKSNITSFEELELKINKLYDNNVEKGGYDGITWLYFFDNTLSVHYLNVKKICRLSANESHEECEICRSKNLQKIYNIVKAIKECDEN